MQIFIKTLAGKVLVIIINNKDTGEQLKKNIQSIDQISLDLQTLIYRGKILENNELLTHYSITDNSIIHLMLNLRGD